MATVSSAMLAGGTAQHPVSLELEVQNARLQFDAMDTDRDGRITAFDYACYMSELTGRPMPIAEASHLMTQTCPGCDSVVDFNNFLRMLAFLKAGGARAGVASKRVGRRRMAETQVGADTCRNFL